MAQSIPQRIATLKKQIDDLASRSEAIAPDNAIGRLSRMEAIGARGVNQTNMSQKEAECQRLQFALQRISEDDYGECEDCGECIGESRLEAVPYASLCITCANEQ